MSLAERRGLRMFTLCVMYVAQGIPWGFTAFTLPAILAKRLDTEQVGAVMAMTTLPYVFKWAWGFLIDALPSKRLGRRRPWIIFAQGMMAATIGVMIAIPDLIDRVTLLMWLVFVNTTFSSMQDVAVDALAVDLLDETERGRANGMMYASKWGGGFLGGWGLSHVIGAFGLRSGLIVQTLVLFAIMLVPLLVRERPGPDQADRAVPVWTSLPAWWRRTVAARSLHVVVGAAARDRAVQSAVVGALMMMVSNLGIAILSAFATVLYTQHLGWTSEDYVGMVGGLGLGAGLVGSLVGGFIADFVGHRRLAALASILLAGFYLLWSLLESHWGDAKFVYSLFWIEPFLSGMLTVSLFALCMDISWRSVAASQFAIYMALANFSSTTGFKIAGRMTEWFTNSGIYQAAAVIQLSLIVLLPLIDPRAAKRERGT